GRGAWEGKGRRAARETMARGRASSARNRCRAQPENRLCRPDREAFGPPPESSTRPWRTSCASLTDAARRQRAAHGLEQKLENLNMALRVRERVAPSVQPMAPQQECMRAVELRQDLAYAFSQPDHVLIVVDDWNPLGVLVRRHASEPLEHLVPLN